jgi:hypothetical protein
VEIHRHQIVRAQRLDRAPVMLGAVKGDLDDPPAGRRRRRKPGLR